ncbi:MAG: hypothetical protein U1D55_00330 [Phycisphaerae bacterium]
MVEWAFVGIVSLILAVAVGSTAVVWRVASRRHVRRRQRLEKRAGCGEAEWLAVHIPEIRTSTADIVAILGILEKELGVDWTQLRPEDSFDDELRLQPISTFIDDELAGYEFGVEDFLRAKGLRGPFPELARARTLRAHLLVISDLLDRSRRSVGGKSGGE